MEDVGEVAEERPLETAKATVVRTEPGLQSLPGNEARLPEVAHPAGEPGVDVEGERWAFQCPQLVSGASSAIRSRTRYTKPRAR